MGGTSSADPKTPIDPVAIVYLPACKTKSTDGGCLETMSTAPKAPINPVSNTELRACKTKSADGTCLQMPSTDPKATIDSHLKVDFIEYEPNPQCGTCREPAMTVLEIIHSNNACLVCNNVPLGRNYKSAGPTVPLEGA